MNKITTLLCVLVVIILVSSCSNEKELDGKWDDNIKLSTKKVEFDAKANAVTITTKGDWWWVHFVSVNDENFSIPENVNVLADSYVFKQNCFTVERKDKNTLYIAIDENLTNKTRKVTIGLEAGNYFDAVVITQASN